MASISVSGATAAASAISGVGLSAESAGNALKGFALAGVAVAAAALTDFVVKSVQAAGDYQQGLTRLTTTAGELPKNLAQVSAGLLKISVDTATSAQTLVASMYTIESGGFHGAAGLQVMTVAAQAARMEQANLTDVSKALVTVLTDYHMPASQAANATNELVTAVSLGRANLEDMSKSMASVLPIASAAGVSFAQVGAAVAVMTNAGNSAQISTKWLANAITALTAPNAVAVKSMTSVGLSAQELSDTLRNKGLGPALQEVTTAVGKTFPAGSVQAVEALKKIMGGVTGYKVALELGGKSMQAYMEDVNKVAASAKIGGTTIQGWSDVQGNFNFKIDQAKAAVGAFMITLGTELLPIFGRLLDQITPMITGFITWESKTHGVENAVKSLVTGIVNMVTAGAGIVKFFKDNEVAGSALEAVLVVLAGVGIMLMVQSLVALGGAVLAATFEMLPMIATIALVSLAVLGIILLIKNWGAIMDWLTGKTKESMLQQQELAQQKAINANKAAEQEKKYVLGQMEDERTQLIAKIKTMADGADKSREQIKLSALNQQIATTKGDIAELDKEKTQHLAKLKELQAQDPQIREQTSMKAIATQVNQKNKILQTLDEERTQLIAKITNERDGSAKTRDLMRLDAVNKQIDTTTGTLKALNNEYTGHMDKLNQMKAADLEARKNWYDRANDAVSAWFSNWNGAWGRAIGTWMSQLGGWVHGNLSRFGEMVGGWMSGMGSWVSGTLGQLGSMVGGWMSWLGTLVHSTASWFGQIPGIVMNALASAASAAFSGGANIVNNIASGIEGAIGTVVSAIGNVAAAITAHLPHSPAKMGPLVGLVDMGAEISRQLAQGMEQSVPTIRAAMNVMLSPVSGVPSGSTGVPITSQQGITVIVNPPPITLDGQRLTNAQMPYIVNAIRFNSGTRL